MQLSLPLTSLRAVLHASLKEMRDCTHRLTVKVLNQTKGKLQLLDFFYSSSLFHGMNQVPIARTPAQYVGRSLKCASNMPAVWC